LLTAQVGYSFDNALVYIKGGAAVTGNHYDVYTGPAFPPPATLAGETGDQTRWGGTLGAGLEYGITPNWSLAVEYDHLFMPDKTTTFTTVGPPGGLFGRDKISQDVDLVGFHLNYHWNG
jgi:outer membrane immunogenic protein